MAGLPCDVCQEDSTVVLNGQSGLDADGVLVYRRWRVCTNPNCERYMHRRETLEHYPEQEPEQEVKIYEPTEVRRILRAMGGSLPPGASGELPLLPWPDGEAS